MQTSGKIEKRGPFDQIDLVDRQNRFATELPQTLDDRLVIRVLTIRPAPQSGVHQMYNAVGVSCALPRRPHHGAIKAPAR